MESEEFMEVEAEMASTGELYDVRYLGNTRITEVHDLDREAENCQIDEIISARHAEPFDTLEDDQGYDSCSFCLGDSKR